MRHHSRVLLAAVAATGLLSLAACNGAAGDVAGDREGADFGDCQVYGQKGSIHIDPVTPGVLTVQTTLPSPGWWKGISADDITGGYEYCLAANIAHRAGLDSVKVVNVSFDALVAGQTKDYDIAMAQISVTPARAKAVTFSAPYFDSNQGVLAPAGPSLTAADLASKNIGVQVGTTAVDFVRDQLGLGSPKVFQDTATMVTGVQSGLTDAAIQDTAIMLGFAKASGGALEVIGQFESGEHYAAIYPHGSANSPAIDGAITAMDGDGTLDKLSATWLGPELGGDPNAVPVWSVQ